jgi:hypothetical protein
LPPGQPAADGHNYFAAALVFLYVELDHALLCGYLLEGADVNLAQQLNVYRPALDTTKTIGRGSCLSRECRNLDNLLLRQQVLACHCPGYSASVRVSAAVAACAC